MSISASIVIYFAACITAIVFFAAIGGCMLGQRGRLLRTCGEQNSKITPPNQLMRSLLA